MKTYPKEVEDYVNQLIKVCEENKETCQDPNEPVLDFSFLRKHILEFALHNFLNKEIINLTDAQFIECWKNAEIDQAIFGLISKGYVDTIEDENGEQITFLTQKGKTFRKTLNR